MTTRSGNLSAKVQAQLVKHGDEAVMVYLADAPIEITRARMPKTFRKLVALIEKTNGN